MHVRSAFARLRGPSPLPIDPAPGASGSQESPSSGPIWIVTPCKGRLSFVRQTLGRVMAHPEARCCMVDYSCPDRVGDWVEKEFAAEVRAGRLVVERLTDGPLFNKCRAHNAGAARARREGADFLCFLDADTLVEPGFHEFIRSQAARDRFLIAGLRQDGSDMPSMTGLLVVHGEAFQRVGGFDEAFAGWGGEDIELRLRLCLLGGLDFEDVPLSLVRPILHDDRLRSQFYQQADIVASNAANMARVHAKLTNEWRGRMVRNPASAQRLWFKHTWGGFSSWSEPTLPVHPAPFREQPAQLPERPRFEPPAALLDTNVRASRRLLAVVSRSRRV